MKRPSGQASRRGLWKTGRIVAVATVVAIGVLAAPATGLAVKPVKPPPCLVSSGVTVQSVKVKGVTTIHVTGTSGTDVIDCSNAKSRVVAHGVAGGGTGDTIYGGSMNDDLYVENTGAGQTDYAIGNGGNDTIHAGGGSAVALAMGDDFDPGAALAGADTIIATGGFVQFYGGAGNDQLDVSAATGSAVEGNVGNDTILGSPGHDSLYGGAGDDTLTDSSGATEIFDCGDGTGDVLNDLDGNGTGANGTGWSGEPEDDTHAGCETVLVELIGPAACTYTAGTTGCIKLENVEITDNPSTAVYTISGDVTFTPTCQLLAADCDPYPTIEVSGGGTFSVTGSQSASGTWTIPAWPNDRPGPSSPYHFTDGSLAQTTCAAADIRTVLFNFPLLSSGGATGGGYLQVRTDDVGTSSRVSGTFFLASLPSGTFQNPADSQAGVTILC